MVVKENAMQFEEPKPGSHIAICFGLIDLGTQIHNFQDKTTHSRDLRILFELTGPKMVGKYREENKGKPFVVGVTCKQSLHPKANLRKLLVGWRGRDFTKEELAGFEIDVLVGKPVRLAMVQREERVWVDGCSPVTKAEWAATKHKLVNAAVKLSLAEGEFDQSVFDSLSNGMREKIARSPEYAALGQGEAQADPDDGSAGVEATAEPASSPEDDDVPF